MDTARASELAKSVDTLVLFLLPKVIDNRQKWASFSDHEEYIKFGMTEARSFLEALPEPYRSTAIKETTYPPWHGVVEFVNSPYNLTVGFRKGVQLVPPHVTDRATRKAMKSADEERVIYVDGSTAVFIPGFDLLFDARDQQGTAAILKAAVNRFYVAVDEEEGGLRAQLIAGAGKQRKVKQAGLDVLRTYLRQGTEIRTAYGVETDVHTDRVVL